MAKKRFKVSIRFFDGQTGPSLRHSDSLRASNIRIAVNRALRGFFQIRAFKGRDPFHVLEIHAEDVEKPGKLPRKIGLAVGESE